jgi:hypothetical protein
VRERFELPALRTLRRLAGTAHRAVNDEQPPQSMSTS